MSPPSFNRHHPQIVSNTKAAFGFGLWLPMGHCLSRKKRLVVETREERRNATHFKWVALICKWGWVNALYNRKRGGKVACQDSMAERDEVVEMIVLEVRESKKIDKHMYHDMCIKVIFSKNKRVLMDGINKSKVKKAHDKSMVEKTREKTLSVKFAGCR